MKMNTDVQFVKDAREKLKVLLVSLEESVTAHSKSEHPHYTKQKTKVKWKKEIEEAINLIEAYLIEVA